MIEDDTNRPASPPDEGGAGRPPHDNKSAAGQGEAEPPTGPPLYPAGFLRALGAPMPRLMLSSSQVERFSVYLEHLRTCEACIKFAEHRAICGEALVLLRQAEAAEQPPAWWAERFPDEAARLEASQKAHPGEGSQPPDLTGGAPTHRESSHLRRPEPYDAGEELREAARRVDLADRAVNRLPRTNGLVVGAIRTHARMLKVHTGGRAHELHVPAYYLEVIWLADGCFVLEVCTASDPKVRIAIDPEDARRLRELLDLASLGLEP